MHREYGGWFSSALHRNMEYLWFGHSGRPLLMFPTSFGRFHQNEDFGLTASLADKTGVGELQLICIDTVDRESWYNYQSHPAERVRRHEQYDRYLRHELVPYIQHRTGRNDLAVFGASFGAYHAANFAARHSDVVSRAILFSGIYDIHRFLSGYWDESCYFNCPTAYLPNLDEWGARRLASTGWVVATGEHDSLAGENRNFAAILSGKGIPVHFELWSGVFGHDWPWWREHLRRFVP